MVGREPTPTQDRCESEPQILPATQLVATLRARWQKHVATVRRQIEQAAIDETTRTDLLGKLEALNTESVVSIEEAEAIMGKEHALGAAAWTETFGIVVPSVPPIPFRRDELERAKTSGQRLVLDVSTAASGQALTLQALFKAMKRKNGWYNQEQHGKLLYDTDWYKDEAFAKTRVPTDGWRLTDATVSPESFEKNYFEQTVLLHDWLRKGGLADPATLDQYQKEIDEWLTKHGFGRFVAIDYDKVNAFLRNDETWQAASLDLAALAINQQHRTSPVQDFAEGMMLLQRGDRLYDGEPLYNWTNCLSSDGHLVNVGGFDADGARVFRSGPGLADVHLGVRLSRSLPSRLVRRD